jgi:hypothetical protein
MSIIDRTWREADTSAEPGLAVPSADSFSEAATGLAIVDIHSTRAGQRFGAAGGQPGSDTRRLCASRRKYSRIGWATFRLLPKHYVPGQTFLSRAIGASPLLTPIAQLPRRRLGTLQLKRNWLGQPWFVPHFMRARPSRPEPCDRGHLACDTQRRSVPVAGSGQRRN